jgi:hypothetical protein
MNNEEEKRKNFEEFVRENSSPEDWSPFLMMIREGAERNAKNLGWENDLIPCIFVEGIFPSRDLMEMIPGLTMMGESDAKEQEGKPGLMIFGVARFCNEQHKEAVASLMFKMALITRATGLAFLHTVWLSIILDVKQLETESDDDFAARCKKKAAEHIPPSKDPNRIEKVMIYSVHHGGQDDGYKAAMADIKREEGKAPVLHNWQILPGGAMDIMGRFPEAMAAGIKMAAKLREMDALMEQRKEEGEEWKS